MLVHRPKTSYSIKRATKRYLSDVLPVSTTRVIKNKSRKNNPNLQDISKSSPKLQNNVNYTKQYRVNEVNIQMISRNIYEQLFKDTTSKVDQKTISSCQAHLKKHGINYEDCEHQPDVMIKLPKLEGRDVVEHFYNIGEKQAGPYRQLLKNLAASQLPPLPQVWLKRAGWCKYTAEAPPEPVPYPDGDALVFDVEVLMSAGKRPTLACAVSEKAWYGWVSDPLSNNAPHATFPDVTYDSLIPLESAGYTHIGEVGRPRVVVGHNVAYDRTKVKEQYWLQKTGLRFMDTMSMHTCVSGVTSYQRAMLKVKQKGTESSDEEWMDYSSLNSLAEVHKLYCGSAIDKTSRNVFVDGTLDDVHHNFQQLMTYCANDVTATFNVLTALLPMFLERFPHPVTMAGMLELGTAYLPVNSNWLQYINSAETVFEDCKLETRQLLSLKADDACRLLKNEEYKNDLWMWDQDWSIQPLKLKKAKKKQKAKANQLTANGKLNVKSYENEVIDGGLFIVKSDENEVIVDDVVNIKSDENCVISEEVLMKTDENFPYLNEDYLDFVSEMFRPPPKVSNIKQKELNNRFTYLYEMAELLPVRAPHLPGYPAWYRKLCTKPGKDDDWTPGANNITTSMQITPKLLRLTWEGYPLHHTPEEKWGFLVPSSRARPVTYEDDGSPQIPLAKLVEQCPVAEDRKDGDSSERTMDVISKKVEEDMGRRTYYARKKVDEQSSAHNYHGLGVWSGIQLQDDFHTIMRKISTSIMRRVRGSSNKILKLFGDRIDTPLMARFTELHVKRIGCCHFLRLPHKDGPKYKVGNPLAKDFLDMFSQNVLSSQGFEAEKVLNFGRMMSYWRNNRERVIGQQVVWLPDELLPPISGGRSNRLYGAILPQVVVAGTLTRRASEPTWMTASNAQASRIGSELRAMVQAPPNYKFVGADVDSQELWISALLGDSSLGVCGGTAFGWSVLAGSRASDTDLHTLTAKAAGVSRDHAKVINYARIYGAGQNFAERLLKQFNPTMTNAEAKSKANKMYSSTKGRRVYKLKPQYMEGFTDDDLSDQSVEMTSYQAMRLAKMSGRTVGEMFERPEWVGGTESQMFNKLEEIADAPSAATAFLSGRLSRALEGAAQWSGTRHNWCVQSAAADFLHLMTSSMAHLQPDTRFSLSFHDEVRYLVPEELKYEAALSLQITNLLTRAFCSQRVGIHDLPQSVAFFTSVEIDQVLRKESHADCITPSNAHGLENGYGIPNGESLSIFDCLEKVKLKSKK